MIRNLQRNIRQGAALRRSDRVQSCLVQIARNHTAPCKSSWFQTTKVFRFRVRKFLVVPKFPILLSVLRESSLGESFPGTYMQGNVSRPLAETFDRV